MSAKPAVPAESKKSKKEKKPVSTEWASEFLDRMTNFPAVYFDARDSSYWFKPKHEWLQLSTRSLTKHFQLLGLAKVIVPGLGIYQTDWPTTNAELNNVVHYAGPLAGHRCGLWTDEHTKKRLITEEASADVWAEKFPEGEPEFFIEFVQELLPGDQWLYLCHWLAFGLNSLRRGDFCPGQAVFFAGPAQCGKSLMQWIITKIFGGRSSDPFNYMFGESKFNYHLIKAEHWCFEDPPLARDFKTRQQFGERLKMCTNNGEFEAHKKGKDAEMVKIFRRVTGSLNDDPEQLIVVPPFAEGVGDKVFLFKCAMVTACLERFVMRDAELPGIGATVARGQLDRFKLQEAILKEIAVSRGWLIRNFSTVPADLSDRRYGIRYWHHPELLAEINAFEPCEKLLVYIDQVWWDEKFPTPWVGKATDMQKAIKEKHVETERLLSGTNSMASHLKKLAKRYPERISKRVLTGNTIWTILPPVKNEEETENVQENGKPAF
jgi:hypothetical protein